MPVKQSTKERGEENVKALKQDSGVALAGAGT